jgi:hypothetical protein
LFYNIDDRIFSAPHAALDAIPESAAPCIISAMANHAYCYLWLRDFDEATRIERLERLLETVPVSKSRLGFSSLVIRAVEPGLPPVAEYDLRAEPITAAEVAALAREHDHPDTAFEVGAHMDLWTRDADSGRWSDTPQPVTIESYGPEYEEGIAAADAGHFQIDAGFEHFFTGHAGLLGTTHPREVQVEHPAEREFLEAMSRPENLRGYQERTRENIQRLLRWIRVVETVLPIERARLWSEGEENFEARLDEILALR